jgi:hypothetical protein
LKSQLLLEKNAVDKRLNSPHSSLKDEDRSPADLRLCNSASRDPDDEIFWSGISITHSNPPKKKTHTAKSLFSPLVPDLPPHAPKHEENTPSAPSFPNKTKNKKKKNRPLHPLQSPKC